MASRSSDGVVAVLGQIPQETRQFTWTLADYAKLSKYSELMMRAFQIELEMGSSIGLPVKILLGVKWQEVDGEGWLCMYVTYMSAPPRVPEVMVNTAVKIQNYVQKECGKVHNLLFGSWGTNLVPLAEEPSHLPLDTNGGLPIEITVTLYHAKGAVRSGLPVTLENLTSKYEGQFIQKLRQDMDKLCENPVASVGAPEIVKLVSKDRKEFSVNWLVLAARSAVFRTMFQTPMSEVEQGLVRLHDIGGEALQVFVKFLHSATLVDNWKEPAILEEVTRAAHKYEIQDLLEFLEEALALVCSSENCGKFFRLARTLELKKAEKALLDKIKEQWTQAKGADQMQLLGDNLAFGE